LPEPLSPTRPSRSPAPSAKDTPSTARASPRGVAVHAGGQRQKRDEDDRQCGDRRHPPPPHAAQDRAGILRPVDHHAERDVVLRPEAQRLQSDRREHGGRHGDHEAGGEIGGEIGQQLGQHDRRAARPVEPRDVDPRPLAQRQDLRADRTRRHHPGQAGDDERHRLDGHHPQAGADQYQHRDGGDGHHHVAAGADDQVRDAAEPARREPQQRAHAEPDQPGEQTDLQGSGDRGEQRGEDVAPLGIGPQPMRPPGRPARRHGADRGEAGIDDQRRQKRERRHRDQHREACRHRRLAAQQGQQRPHADRAATRGSISG
jgi:hypothetical protein